MSEIWSPEEEAHRLRERFLAVPNKAAFARSIGLKGGPSMLSQHCSGNRPINLEAALAYARGFNVSLADISPRLAVVAGKAHVVMDPPTADEAAPPALHGSLETVGKLIAAAAGLVASMPAGKRESIAQLAALMLRNGPSDAVSTAIDELSESTRRVRDQLAHGIPVKDDALKRYVQDTMGAMSEQERASFMSVATSLGLVPPSPARDFRPAATSDGTAASKRARR